METIALDSQAARAAQQQAVTLAELFVRNGAHLLKLQSAAARAMLASQGRSAAMLGAPDWSGLFSGPGNEQLEQLFEAAAEQSVRMLRACAETMQQVQQQFAVLVGQQTCSIAQQVGRAVEELNRRSSEGVEQWARVSEESLQRAHDAGVRVQHEVRSEQRADPAIIVPDGGANASLDERPRMRRGA
jgi:hypothetical protein